MLPFVFVAPVLGDLAVGLALPAPFEAAAATLIGTVYGAAALFLRHPRQHFDRSLQSMAALFQLTFTTAVSAAVVALGYSVIMVASGMLPLAGFVPMAASYWVGDMIGIMVMVPPVIVLWNRRYGAWLSATTLRQVTTILVMLTLCYLSWWIEHVPVFYPLFVPIVWMALSNGFDSVVLGILVAQLAFVLGFHSVIDEVAMYPTLQGLMLVLDLTGLFAGSLVTERRRTEAVLQLHQESLARLGRLGSVGELAAAIAHEVNQPLMAAGTYTRLVDDAIRSGHGNAETTAETARKAAAQVERAALVVRRLRALVRLDRSNRAAWGVDQIVRETAALCRPDLERAGVRIVDLVTAGQPAAMVDKLQIEQALLNLVRNSIEAIAATGARGGTITITARPADDFVEVGVHDSGPGFPPERAADPFLPLSSTKNEGLGVGLSLARSLIEAHGGRIWLDRDAQGAAMHFTLPTTRAASVKS
jgi:signal transduction histidine kinase